MEGEGERTLEDLVNLLDVTALLIYHYQTMRTYYLPEIASNTALLVLKNIESSWPPRYNL